MPRYLTTNPEHELKNEVDHDEPTSRYWSAVQVPNGEPWFIVEVHVEHQGKLESNSWISASIEEAARLCRRGEKGVWSKVFLVLGSPQVDTRYFDEIREAHRSPTSYVFHWHHNNNPAPAASRLGPVKMFERLRPVYVQQAW